CKAEPSRHRHPETSDRLESEHCYKFDFFLRRRIELGPSQRNDSRTKRISHERHVRDVPRISVVMNDAFDVARDRRRTLLAPEVAQGIHANDGDTGLRERFTNLLIDVPPAAVAREKDDELF